MLNPQVTLVLDTNRSVKSHVGRHLAAGLAVAHPGFGIVCLVENMPDTSQRRILQWHLHDNGDVAMPTDKNFTAAFNDFESVTFLRQTAFIVWVTTPKARVLTPQFIRDKADVTIDCSTS